MEENIFLREYDSLTYVLPKINQKLPPKSLAPRKWTCLDAGKQLIALACSDNGVVFLYNRTTFEVQKLKHDVENATVIKIYEGIDLVVAVGRCSGNLSLFQLPSVLPQHPKQMQILAVNGLHNSAVRCLEWSTNGMKLFSADDDGLVVATELEYQHDRTTSKSYILCKETGAALQLCYINKLLLFSTTSRCVLHFVDDSQTIQIGNKDKKVSGSFGGVLLNNNRNINAYVARPGLRMWKANAEGTVEATYLFKEQVVATAENFLILEDTTDNNLKAPPPGGLQFGLLHVFKRDYLVTFHGSSVFLIDPVRGTLAAYHTRVGTIRAVSVCDDEIFILRDSIELNLIRIALTKDQHMPIQQVVGVQTQTNPISLGNFVTVAASKMQQGLANTIQSIGSHLQQVPEGYKLGKKISPSSESSPEQTETGKDAAYSPISEKPSPVTEMPENVTKDSTTLNICIQTCDQKTDKDLSNVHEFNAVLSPISSLLPNSNQLAKPIISHESMQSECDESDFKVKVKVKKAKKNSNSKKAQLGASSSDCVLTNASSEGVLTTASSDCILTNASLEGVLTTASSEGVLTNVSLEGVLTNASSQGVLANASSEDILTTASSEGVLTNASLEGVLTTASSQGVLANASSEDILTTASSEGVFTSAVAIKENLISRRDTLLNATAKLNDQIHDKNQSDANALYSNAVPEDFNNLIKQCRRTLSYSNKIQDIGSNDNNALKKIETVYDGNNEAQRVGLNDNNALKIETVCMISSDVLLECAGNAKNGVVPLLESSSDDQSESSNDKTFINSNNAAILASYLNECEVLKCKPNDESKSLVQIMVDCDQLNNQLMVNNNQLRSQLMEDCDQLKNQLLVDNDQSNIAFKDGMSNATPTRNQGSPIGFSNTDCLPDQLVVLLPSDESVCDPKECLSSNREGNSNASCVSMKDASAVFNIDCNLNDRSNMLKTISEEKCENSHVVADNSGKSSYLLLDNSEFKEIDFCDNSGTKLLVNNNNNKNPMLLNEPYGFFDNHIITLAADNYNTIAAEQIPKDEFGEVGTILRTCEVLSDNNVDLAHGEILDEFHSDDFYSKYLHCQSDNNCDQEKLDIISHPLQSSGESSKVENQIVIDWSNCNRCFEISCPSSVQQLSSSRMCTWCVDASNHVWYLLARDVALITSVGRWRRVDVPAQQISVSPSGSILWRLTHGSIFVANKVTNNVPYGTKWEEIAKKVAYIAVDDHIAWYIKNDGRLIAHKGLSRDHPWRRAITIDCQEQIIKISCRHGVMWALSNQGAIIARAGISEGVEEGTKWKKVSCPKNRVTHIAVGDDGTAWSVDNGGRLWFMNGVTVDTSCGSGVWYQVSLCSSDIFQELDGVDDFKKNISICVNSTCASLVVCKNVISISPSGVWLITEGCIDAIRVYAGQLLGELWTNGTPSGVATMSKWRLLCALGASLTEGLIWAQQSSGVVVAFAASGRKAMEVALPNDRIPCMCISVSQTAVWCLLVDGGIYVRAGISSIMPVGSHWLSVDMQQLDEVHMIHISCGEQCVWGVDRTGDIYMRLGNCAPSQFGLNQVWIPVDGCTCIPGAKFTLVMTSPDDRMVWAVDNRHNVYVRKGVTDHLPVGTCWYNVPGVQVEQLALSKQNVYVLSTKGEVYVRCGICDKFPIGSRWTLLAGNCRLLSVTSDDQLWCVDLEGMLLCHTVQSVFCAALPSLTSLSDDWEFVQMPL